MGASPSRWSRRAPLVILAACGCVIATYLTLYQVGAIPNIWDPIFGAGSRRVVTSSLSRSLPIPDAMLGALAYLADLATGSIGGGQRWRTMPWIVLAMGLVAAGLVVAALGLIAAQVLLVHDGCTLCLASAAISLTTGWLAKGEVFAAVGRVRERLGRGDGLAPALLGQEAGARSTTTRNALHIGG